MKPREFPGALALGLPVALLAHVLAFGGDHSLGGAYHQALAVGAVLAAAALAMLLVGLACSSARATQTGSVLAARVATLLPGDLPLAAGATGWFIFIESLEPHHRALPVLAAVALVAAAMLVGTIARALTRMLAEITIAILDLDFSPRIPAYALCIAERTPRALNPAIRRRLYSRPPPNHS
ncbi:MAG: hypothetical protein ABI182_08265 [Candidatus Baltobacteraceae bacterium]